MAYGVITLADSYTYEGSIHYNEAHGKGTFYYSTGDKYIGNCKLGKRDGFGIYYFGTTARYTGYFSYGKFNGIGTYENADIITKGTWRNDRQHGVFYMTEKKTHLTYQQLFFRGSLRDVRLTQYIQPAALATTIDNPIKKPKVYQVSYKAQEKKCIGCAEKNMNATNNNCGHVTMCYDCLCKCDRCPICRTPIDRIIKLYVS